MKRSRWFAFAVLLSVFLISCLALAESEGEPSDIPQSLEEWVPWVLGRQSDIPCASLLNSKACLWTGGLKLVVDSRGGSFELQVRADRDRTFVPLPGGETSWPIEVTVGEVPAKVLRHSLLPHAVVSAGVHEIKGRFRWEEAPEYIKLPASLAILGVTAFGKEIPYPKFNSSGELWLYDRGAIDEPNKETPIEPDALRIKIFRKVQDGVPFIVETELHLTVVGRVREVNLGRVNLPDSWLIDIRSELPHRLIGEELLVQVKPGQHTLSLTSHYSTPPNTLSVLPVEDRMNGGSGVSIEWPVEELWAWSDARDIRRVEIQGASQIDPSQTELPTAWRGLPVFLLQEGGELHFQEKERGELAARANRISLNRQLWLDLDGDDFTTQDQISGVMNQDWRLRSHDGHAIGRVAYGDENKLITKDIEGGAVGVELRASELNLVADGRIEAKTSLFRPATFSAVGWRTDVSSLGGDLHLPPGWRLFGAAGVDFASNTWLGAWTLLDSFVVFLIAVATGKLLGVRAGLLALGALVLTHGEYGAPFQLWFHLLAATALLRVLPVGQTQKYVSLYFKVAIFFLALHLFFFALRQMLFGLYPQLALTPHSMYSDTRISSSLTTMLDLIEGSLGALVMIGSLVVGIISVFLRRWKTAGVLVCVFAFSFVLRSMTATFFDDKGIGGHEVALMSKSARNVAPSAPQVGYDELSSGDYMVESVEEALYQKQKPKKLRLQTDSQAVIQTGRGVPNWIWNRVHFGWTGPVHEDAEVSFFLVGPWTNLALAVGRILFLLGLALCFVRGREGGGERATGGHALASTLVVFFLGLVCFSPAPVSAEEYPSESLLKELETRLMKDRCTEDCLTVQTLNLKAKGSLFTLTASVSADGDSAWIVPGSSTQFYVQGVGIDGKDTIALRRDSEGDVAVRVPSGNHEVQVRAVALGASALTLRFRQEPGTVTLDVPEWEVEGVEKGGVVKGSLQLTRRVEGIMPSSVSEELPAPQPEELESLALPERYLVIRHIEIDLPWTLRTTVKRFGSAERSSIARFPLLPYEKLSTSAVKSEGREVVVSFSRGQREASWESTLEELDTIALSAATDTATSEEWHLYCGEEFRCRHSGLTPTATLNNEGIHEYSWHPYPKEEVSVSIQRLEAAPGIAVTVQSSKLEVRPGDRIIDGVLEVQMLASRAERILLELPAKANISQLAVNGLPQMVRAQDGKVEVPLPPGSSNFRLEFDMARDGGIKMHTPKIKMNGTWVNSTLTVSLSSDRWILLTGGPAWGPSVLFWGKLIVVVGVALVLSRLRSLPLTTAQWTLLGMGLATLPASVIGIPLLWFLAMDFRRRKLHLESRWFNLSQLLLVLFTLANIVVYFVAIRNGLIMSPNMNIQGNGSMSTLLQWYQDFSESSFPEGWVVSAPLWVWRVVALLWSVWIVFALIRWLRWGWECFSTGTLWVSRAQKTASLDQGVA